MNLQELIEAARKSVLAGNLEEAEKFTAQAKALKAIDGIQPEPSEEVKTLKSEVEGLRQFKARIEAEPASSKAGTVVVTQDETDKKAAMPFKSLGDQLKAIAQATMYPHQADERIKAQKAVLGQNEGQSSEGGFLVQTDFVNQIFTLMHDASMLASRCRRIPVGPNANGVKMNAIDETSRATGSRWGGVRGYWVAEGGSLTAGQVKFRQMELNLKKLGALMYATDELLADTTALGSIMEQAASEELAFILDDAILNGTGAGMPLGILNSPSLISVSKEAGQVAATLDIQNIFKMWSRMYARSRMNAVWLINQDIETQLFSMTFPIGTGGVPVYLPPGGLAQSPLATLMGRPMIPTEFNPTLGTVGDIMLVDLSQYLLIDKGGVQGASSIHVAFLTDQQAFRWIYRVDGQPLWISTLTPFKGSSTTSPFVALASRA